MVFEVLLQLVIKLYIIALARLGLKRVMLDATLNDNLVIMAMAVTHTHLLKVKDGLQEVLQYLLVAWAAHKAYSI